jgi:hypothetical protein
MATAAVMAAREDSARRRQPAAPIVVASLDLRADEAPEGYGVNQSNSFVKQLLFRP